MRGLSASVVLVHGPCLVRSPLRLALWHLKFFFCHVEALLSESAPDLRGPRDLLRAYVLLQVLAALLTTPELRGAPLGYSVTAVAGWFVELRFLRSNVVVHGW